MVKLERDVGLTGTETKAKNLSGLGIGQAGKISGSLDFLLGA